MVGSLINNINATAQRSSYAIHSVPYTKKSHRVHDQVTTYQNIGSAHN